MAVVFNGEVAEVHMRSTLFGQRIESVAYCQKAAGWSVTDLNTLAAACAEWYTTQVYSQLSNSIIFRECTAIGLDAADAPGVVNVQYAGNIGQLPNPSLPGSIAACVSFRTAYRGRSARGRNYVAGIPENVVDGNTMNPIWAGNLMGAYNNLGAVMSVAGGVHVVYSQYKNKLKRVFGLPYPVNAYVFTDLFVDSQRKRLTGRGI